MAEKIAVTTSELKKKQEEWLIIFGQIEADFAEMNELAGRLDQFFMGQPVESIKNRRNELQEKAEASLEQLKIHLQKLTQIGRIYAQTEEENKNVITNN